MVEMGERPHIGYLQVGLVGKSLLGRLRHHKVRLDAGISKQLQQPHTVSHARGPGDTDNQPRGRAILHRLHSLFRDARDVRRLQREMIAIA